MITFILTAMTLLLAITPKILHARDWARINIPGARCGDGSPYTLFLDKRDLDKLAVEFMGGGTCWNASTCYGPNLRTWLHPIPEIKNYSVMTKEKNILSHHSMIYFPYCNGDVFAGDHVAEYELGLKVRHMGRSNIEKAFKYLIDKEYINPKNIKNLLLYGSSAGAIGALMHMNTVDMYFGNETKKTVIADSPGLHFGEHFWEKFPEEMIRDFKVSFDNIGLDTDFSSGLVAPYMGEVCHKLKNWNIGIMQSTKDIVMSVIFGSISVKQHAALVLGPQGVKAVTEGIENCEVWNLDSYMHTFLLLESSAKLKDDLSQHETALEFAERIYQKNL